MAKNREMARRHLDKRFQNASPDLLRRPPKGWVQTIRDALGMTTTQLAKRMGLVQSRIVAIEQDEVQDKLTLSTLTKAADALECEFVYALVPRQSLAQIMKSQAFEKAKKAMAETKHTMQLENQSVDEDELQIQFEKLVQKFLESSPKKLWDDA